MVLRVELAAVDAQMSVGEGRGVGEGRWALAGSGGGA